MQISDSPRLGWCEKKYACLEVGKRGLLRRLRSVAREKSLRIGVRDKENFVFGGKLVESEFRRRDVLCIQPLMDVVQRHHMKDRLSFPERMGDRGRLR